MRKKELIGKIIEIAQTDGELMTDGECLDRILDEISKAGYDIFDQNGWLKAGKINEKSFRNRVKSLYSRAGSL